VPIVAFAKVHYAKVEPLERATIKSAVSGAIVKVNLSAEGTLVEDAVVVHIDDKVDKSSLKASNSSLTLLKETLSLNQQILKGLSKIRKNKKSYYDRVASLRSSTKVLKDNSYDAYVTASNQMLSTKEKVANLKKQVLDLEQKVITLQDTISKKSIKLQNKYLYKLSVREGGFATPGMPLAIADDLSSAKLVIYLDRGELDKISDKTIYIDDQPTDLKFSRIWSVADEKFVSSYRAEIVMKPVYKFSKLLKIEIK